MAFLLIPQMFFNLLKAFVVLASMIEEKMPENGSVLFSYFYAIGEAYHVYGGQA